MRLRYRSIAKEDVFDWSWRDIHLYILNLLRRAENDLPRDDRLRQEARLVYDTLIKPSFESGTPMHLNSDERTFAYLFVHERIGDRVIVVTDFYSGFAWFVTVLDDTIHAYGEGPAFYKRVAVRFAKLCDTITTDVFAPSWNSFLGTAVSPAKIFIYWNPRRYAEETSLEEAIAFLSVGVPQLTRDKWDFCVGPNAFTSIRRAVAHLRRMLVITSIMDVDVQPQDDRFYPMGYCAESMSFAARLPLGGPARGVCISIEEAGQFEHEEDCENAEDASYITPCCNTCSTIVEHARQVYQTKFEDLGRAWQVHARREHGTTTNAQLSDCPGLLEQSVWFPKELSATTLPRSAPESQGTRIGTMHAEDPSSSSHTDSLPERDARSDCNVVRASQYATVIDSRTPQSIEAEKMSNYILSGDQFDGPIATQSSSSPTWPPAISEINSTSSYPWGSHSDEFTAPPVRHAPRREASAGPSSRSTQGRSPRGTQRLARPTAASPRISTAPYRSTYNSPRHPSPAERRTPDYQDYRRRPSEDRHVSHGKLRQRSTTPPSPSKSRR